MNSIKVWNDKQIRIRPSDRYTCLTDMADAIDQVDITRFLSSSRLLEIKGLLYEQQSNSIQHPIQVDGELIWVHKVVAQEFSHQLIYGSISQSKEAVKFALFLDDIFWEDVLSQSPNVIQKMWNDVSVAITKPSFVKTLADKASVKSSGYVYFMFNVTQNQVKIGHSHAPDHRLSAFKAATTDEWIEIGRLVGTKTDEKKYHNQFSLLNVKGKAELFYYKNELKSFMTLTFPLN